MHGKLCNFKHFRKFKLLSRRLHKASAYELQQVQANSKHAIPAQDMQKEAPSQHIGKMFRAASENSKKPPEVLEEGVSADEIISETAANSCEISYRSYSEKVKRQRRSLSASEARTGREARSRSATPEPELEVDGIGSAPTGSRSRLDVDGEAPFLLVCCCQSRSTFLTGVYDYKRQHASHVAPADSHSKLALTACSHGIHRAAQAPRQHTGSQEVNSRPADCDRLDGLDCSLSCVLLVDNAKSKPGDMPS